MAEKKFPDMIYGFIVGLFFLGLFTTFFISADKIMGVNDGVGVSLEGLGNDSQGDYSNLEVRLEQDTYNESTFSVTENIQVDTRGVSQAITTAKDSSSNSQSFISNAANLVRLHPLITTLIISSIILVGIQLFLRFIRPGGA